MTNTLTIASLLIFATTLCTDQIPDRPEPLDAMVGTCEPCNQTPPRPEEVPDGCRCRPATGTPSTYRLVVEIVRLVVVVLLSLHRLRRTPAPPTGTATPTGTIPTAQPEPYGVSGR